MNIKRIFGSVLTVLGIVGLIYAAVVFAGSDGNSHSTRVFFVYFILSLIFFVSGIGLIRGISDKHE